MQSSSPSPGPPASFHRLNRQYVHYCQHNPVPPAIHYKLTYLSCCLKSQRVDQLDLGDIDPDQFKQLRELDQQTQLRLFTSIARCVMGLQPTDRVRDREVYIKREGMLVSWEKCLVTIDGDRLLIRQKELMQIPLNRVRISATVKRRKKKYTFIVEIKKKLFYIGLDAEKPAIQLHAALKQMILEHCESAKEEDGKILESEIQDDSMDKELEASKVSKSSDEEVDKDTDEFDKIQDQANFKLLQYLENGRILKSQFEGNVLKCFLLIKLPISTTSNPCQLILNIFLNFKQWNPQIDKYLLASKPDINTYLVYQKYKKQGLISFPRDYVMLKKAVKFSKERYGLVETAAQHQDYPTEYLSVRGEIKRTSVFEMRRNKEQGLVLLVTKLEVMKGNDEDVNVGIRYLQSYDKFPSYCLQKMMLQNVERFFNFETPKLQPNQPPKRPLRTFMSLQDHIPKSPPTMQLPTLFQCLPRDITTPITQPLCQLVRSNQHFSHNIRTKYIFEPVPSAFPTLTQASDFLMQKGDWLINEDQEMVFVNQEAIDAQKDIIKYILKQIGSNLIHGKLSVMNMSLPVDIFDDRSILERSAASYGYAPVYLNKAGMSTEVAQQLKYCMLFLMSMPLLQMKAQKPFNPTLGQTFQGRIAGIPVYWQQTSHHPPISSYFMKSNYFQLFGSTLARAQMHFNSVTGVNAGVMNIKLCKGTHVKCYMPSVEVSGLLYGQRKIKIVNRSFLMCEEQQMVCEVNFGGEKNGVGSWSGRHGRLTSSSVTGGIFKVEKDFFKRFKKQAKKDRFQGVLIKDIIEKHSSIEGYWNGDVSIDGQIVRKRYDPLPYPLEYELYPLASHSNYRQDILYKRMGKLDIAQVKKQQIENIQRRDRKLRADHRGTQPH